VALATTRALVLQAFPYSETSKVLRLYTLELGLQSVMARGALRPRSRYGGVLEPFTEGSATFYHREGRDLHTLSGFDLLRSRQALGRSLMAFAGASLQAELVIRTATEEPHPALFHTLVDAWEALAAADGPDAVLAAAFTGTWAVVSLQGFEPEAAGCVRCARALADDEPSRFDAAAGGVVCTRCRPEGRMLDPGSRAELRRMVAGEPVRALGRPSTHRALLRAYLDAQLAGERPLRSLDLFMESASAPETQGGAGDPGSVA
jgi:DNA repair protein RecO (recombination protein O)